MQRSFISALALFFSIFLTSASYAISWETSCGVDRGSIERKSGTYTFRTSTNHCTGGIFTQRAEINTGDISIRKAGIYVFETTIAMTSSSNEDFVFFQIHDGRDGCSPPLSLRWRGNGRLSFDSDYTRGQGMAGCVENRTMRDARYSGPALRRDGTSYQVQVQLAFDGAGGFDVTVLIDGATAISGPYRPSSDAAFVPARRFFMKHGVYSRNMFDYVMTSSGMRAFQAR